MIPDSKKFKTWVEVDAKNFRANIRTLKKTVGKDVALLVVLKSNAYGHGLDICVRIAGVMPEVAMIGVDSIDEALIVKNVAPKKSIVIVGYVPPLRHKEAVQHGFRVALYDKDVLLSLEKIAKAIHKPALVHIKIETGTNRQGIMRTQWEPFARLVVKSPHVVVEGVYTHFADTEDASSTFYKTQINRFNEALTLFKSMGIRPKYIHAASSAGLMLYPEARFSMVRGGISIYGIYASLDVQHLVLNKIELKPVLTWKTRIAQIKELQVGDTVSYNRTFTAEKRMKIAILPVGYWDGFDRRFSNKGNVLIRGIRAPLVGKVCMNMMMVDVTHLPALKPGEEVVILGRQGKSDITVDDLAKTIGTIPYEITTRINPLLPRIVV